MNARNELARPAAPAPAILQGIPARRAALIRRRPMPVLLPAMLVEAPVAQMAPGPAAASARPTQRINPTKRTLRFIVPVTDGPVYLGDIDLAVAPDDALSVQAARLLQLLDPIVKPDVLGRITAASRGGDSITARQLAAEHIGLSYDSQKLSLALDIPVAARRTSSVSLRNLLDGRGETLKAAGFSAYLNLRAAVDLIERGPESGVTPPVSLIDGAARLLGVVAEGEGYLSARKGEPAVRRTGSRLVYDDLAHTMRWIFGDLRPLARSFQAGPTVAGLAIARSYSVLEPQREVRSSGSQSFSLFSPSTVETVVNGRTVERKLLQPGNYTLQDFPLAEGANNVRLQIEDETGKRRTIEFSAYSNRALLEPGLTEFSAFGGVYSQPTRAGIFYSRQWTSGGFVRRGLSQHVTAGVNFQADRQARQIGAEILFGSPLGLLGFDLAHSQRTVGGSGYAAAASFEKIVQGLSGRSQSFRAIVELRSAGFAVPGALVDREPLAVRASAGYSLTLARDTYVALDGQYARDRVRRGSTYGVRGSGGVALGERLGLVGEVEYQRSSDRREIVARLGLRMRFGQRAFGQLDADSDGGVRASYQASNGRGIGAWSASVDAQRDPSGSTLNANGTYAANRMELGVSQLATYDDRTRSVSNVRTSLRMATSLAFAGGSFAVGRPIQDGFLIARTHSSLKGKPVRIDPQEQSEEARSGRLGPALDGNLSAYSARLLVYDVPGAPPGYDLGQGNVQIVPPYRGGYRLEVGSAYHLLVIGRLLDRQGEPVSLLAGKAVDLGAPKRPAVTVFTARNGRFAAQGLRPGRWRIDMPSEPPTSYELEVDDNSTGTVRLSDLRPVTAKKDMP